MRLHALQIRSTHFLLCAEAFIEFSVAAFVNILSGILGLQIVTDHRSRKLFQCAVAVDSIGKVMMFFNIAVSYKSNVFMSSQSPTTDVMAMFLVRLLSKRTRYVLPDVI